MAKPKVPGSPLRSGPDPAKVSQAGRQKAALARLKPINPPRMTGTAAHAGKARDDVIGTPKAPKRTPAQIARHTPLSQVSTFKPSVRLNASQITDRRGQPAPRSAPGYPAPETIPKKPPKKRTSVSLRGR